MNAKVLVAGLVSAMVAFAARAEEYPDLSRTGFAGRSDSLWSQVLPALLFFVGLALIGGLFLLAQLGSSKRQNGQKVLEEIAKARKEGRPLQPPPGGPARFPRQGTPS